LEELSLHRCSLTKYDRLQNNYAIQLKYHSGMQNRRHQFQFKSNSQPWRLWIQHPKFCRVSNRWPMLTKAGNKCILSGPRFLLTSVCVPLWSERQALERELHTPLMVKITTLKTIFSLMQLVHLRWRLSKYFQLCILILPLKVVL